MDKNSTRLAMPLAVSLLLVGCAVKPQPLTTAEIQARVEKDMVRLFADQDPITAPVSLDEALRRALSYNLDKRIKLMEEALAKDQLELGFFDMWPKVSGGGGRNNRSHFPASTSESLLDGSESLELSTSQEKTRTVADGNFYWNLLDFGVSYVQAKQNADQVLIAEQRKRKAVQDLSRDVRQAFFRAASAQALLPQMEKLLKKSEAALDKSRKMEKKGLQKADEALQYQEELLQRIRQLWGMRQDLVTAKTQLASLMNMRPGTPFELDLSLYEEMSVPALEMDMVKMEEAALKNRPELIEEDLQERISGEEARKALLRMLPGLEINLTRNYDSNKYLANNAWTDSAFRIAVSLNEILVGPHNIEFAKAQQELAVTRRLSMAMAILTQVHLATERFQMSTRDFELAKDLLTIKQRRAKRAKAAKEAESGDELAVISMAMGELVAKMQRDVAFADMRHAHNMILHSMGMFSLQEDSAAPKQAPAAVAPKQAPAAVAPKQAPAAAPQEGRAAPLRNPEYATPLPHAMDTNRELDGGHLIQVGSFRKEENARAMAEQLAGKGYSVMVGGMPTGQWWWVRLGPFADRDSAKEAAVRWRNTHGSAPMVL